MNYIYLIREREFINSEKNVFKIGKTTQRPEKRMANYPKDSEIILFVQVNNCDTMEPLLIDRFKNKFRQCTEIGTESFEGDRYLMMDEIITSIKYHDIDAPPRIPVKRSSPKKESVKVVPKRSPKKMIPKETEPNKPEYVVSDKNIWQLLSEKYRDSPSIASRLVPYFHQELTSQYRMWGEIFEKYFKWTLLDKVCCESDKYYLPVLKEGKVIFKVNIPICDSRNHIFDNITLIDKKSMQVRQKGMRAQLCSCLEKCVVGTISYAKGGYENIAIVECRNKYYLIGVGYPSERKDYWESIYGEQIVCDSCGHVDMQKMSNFEPLI
jgi:hypothetical protein